VYCCSEVVLVVVAVAETPVELLLVVTVVVLPVLLTVERVLLVSTPMQIYCMLTEGSAADPVDVEK
jgi:hypothetical protein